MECCHIPVVGIYSDISGPSGVNCAAVVSPVDVWPPSADNGFHSHYFTCEVYGMPRTQSDIHWLCQQTCWSLSNVVWSFWFHTLYKIKDIYALLSRDIKVMSTHKTTIWPCWSVHSVICMVYANALFNVCK